MSDNTTPLNNYSQEESCSASIQSVRLNIYFDWMAPPNVEVAWVWKAGKVLSATPGRRQAHLI